MREERRMQMCLFAWVALIVLCVALVGGGV